MRHAIFSLCLLAAPACGGKTPTPVAADAAPSAPKAAAGKDDHAADHAHGDDKAHGDDHAHGDDPAHGHDHGADGGHMHKAPHGGEVKSIGAYHLELVPTKAGLLVFPLDGEERELPLAGVTGKVTFVADGKEPVEATLEPMGNHLHAMVVLDGAWKAAVAVTIKGEAFSARFEGTGIRTSGMAPAGHDHGAGGHDHGAAGHDHGGEDHAMPAMKLSEAVEAFVTADGLAAGKPVSLQIRFERKDPRAPVTDFEVSHEKKLHFFIVSEDMSVFAHEHPEAADVASGTWTLPFTFPSAGKYRLYSDFKSTALGATVAMATLEVPGTAPAKAPLVVDSAMQKTFGSIKVTLATTPSPLGLGDAMIKYTIEDAVTGQPVTDLEPYLGAFAHLFILNEDLISMAHAHPRGAEPTADSRGGPTVELHASLPKTGIYKLWGQFQRGGKVITTDWTLEAKAVDSAPMTEIAVSVDRSGYSPAVIEVPAAGKVKLLFKRTEEVGCGGRVVFPSLGIDKELPVGAVVAVEVEAKAGERLAFTCGMGMFKGAVVVQ